MVWEQITEYTICAVPPNVSDEWYHWSITVTWRSEGRWAVCSRFGECLGTDGKWDYERLNSSRTDEWKATHRFSEQEALRLAHAIAPTITVNGITPADLIAKYRP